MNSKNRSNTLKNTSSNAKEEICISLVGPPDCGKSALLVKYITRRFIGEYDPYYEGCWTKHENLDGNELNIQIMDTYDKDRKNLERYLKWSDALILVYNITNNQSFLIIQEYLEQICEIIKKMSDDPVTEKPNAKIILLGNKIDMERYRQVNKQDVENLINKYSSNTSNFYKDSSATQSSETTPTTESTPKPLVNLNLIHMETTSCEEYEIVQNFFHKIIRTVKRERELNQLSNPAPPVIEENLSGSKTKPKLSSNTKRAKSPKQNMYNMIQDPSQSSPDKHANTLSTVVTQSPISQPNSNYISISNNNNSNNSSSSNVNTNSINTIGGSTLNSININPSGYSSSTISVSNNSNNNAASGGATNSPGSLSNSKDTKKNSSKFPFLTKILNKS